MKKKIPFDDDAEVEIKKWYEDFQKGESPTKHGKSEMDVIDLKAQAKKYLDSESAAYHLKESKSQNSEYSWLKTALSKGTTSDKVAAGVILVQNSPKHNLNHLTMLINQVKVAKHNQCTVIIDALKDLFISDLLHPKYKLLKFEEQNFTKLDILNQSSKDDNVNSVSKKNMSKSNLLTTWYFEDQLKELYDRFITSLTTIANDTVDTNREKAISVMNELLMKNSEQEHRLLDLIINKIGDPTSKVAAKAIFALTKLLYEHPHMKLTVLHEVEKLLFRNNVSSRTQYFAICLLSQFVLSKEDTEAATTLINVYFAFFNACLKKGEPESRMMAAILTGVNRAYPFADINSTKLNEHIDSVYKVVHLGSFNVSLNALNLLFQVVNKNPKHSDRFYSTFYRKLFDSQIGVSNKRAIFLNLLFKALRSDTSIVRMHAFMKRILQISAYFPANMACATLYVISQVLNLKKFSKKILIRSKKTGQGETETETDLSVNDKSSIKEISIPEKKKDNIILSNVISETVENSSEDIKPENVEIKTELRTTVYDPFIRNPLHCGANLSFYCELEALANHFHPSVSLFAKTILEGKRIDYTGDPLEDLTLIRFLDRYVFKNPKKLESKRVVKKNDPLAKRTAYIPRGIRAIPVDSLAYLNEREERIPVDELFLYQYMRKQKETKGFKKERKADDDNDEEDDDDNESVNSEDFNDMLDKLSTNKNLDELDIAGDFNPQKMKNGNKFEDEDDEDDDDDDDDDDNEDDDVDDDDEDEDEDIEIDNENNSIEELDGDDEFENLSDLEDIDDDASDMEFDDDDDDDSFNESHSKKRKMNKTVKNISKKLKGLEDKTFVSAEEFAEMLEEQGRSKFKHGTSKNYSDRDGASAKQLDWESERNQRITGFRRAKSKKISRKFKGKSKVSKPKKSIKKK